MPIRVIYTRTEKNRPLVHLDGGPFNGCDYTPDQLQALADWLLRIKASSLKQPLAGHYWQPATVQIDASVAVAPRAVLGAA